MLSSDDIRRRYIEFFTRRGHTRIPSASLLPDNDATVLFTSAGMQPLVPYFSGREHPHGRRLVNSQRRLRTSDIDEVGDDSHLTCFEMLGNWSLGDYFKRDSLRWSLELLTDRLTAPVGRTRRSSSGPARASPKATRSPTSAGWRCGTTSSSRSS